VAGEAITPGDIVLIALPSHDPSGHEQEGVRPAIVVGVPQGLVRYPVVVAVPLTTTAHGPGKTRLYITTCHRVLEEFPGLLQP
jgi:mRNA-degrading endonuclease toxin of MazEF toxin-antitoxin module